MADPEYDKVLSIDLQCFPSIDYCIILVKHNTLKFEQYEQVQKRSYSNRYYVAGANGQILLSIPLLHEGGEKRVFKEVKICDRQNWQRDHWRTLTSAYRRSPWFEFYEDALRPMYEKKFVYLLDWNLEAFELISRWLGTAWKFSFSDDYQESYKGTGMVDARNRFYPGMPRPDPEIRYRQVFEERTGFIPGLSILDLIFCEGKRATSILNQASAG